MKPVIIVTATYKRQGQIENLSRVGRMLTQYSKLISFPLQWIVVEDWNEPTPKVQTLLAKLRSRDLKIVNLFFGPTRAIGHAQKASAIRFIRSNALSGNVMFFDDDNFASIEHFERCSQVDNVGIWRVNNVSIRGSEGPIVEQGKVVGFDGGFKSRQFAIDTAGFAIDASHLTKVSDEFLNTNQGYNWETLFLQEMFDDRSELEPFGQGKICYVSHNEPIDGHCEQSWIVGDQPMVYRLNWRYTKNQEIGSKELGQFKTLANSLTYAKERLFDAVNFRYNANKHTRTHESEIDGPVSSKDIEVINYSTGPNEELESWE